MIVAWLLCCNWLPKKTSAALTKPLDGACGLQIGRFINSPTHTAVTALARVLGPPQQEIIA